MAAADRTARGGGLPRRRPRPARLQPVVAAGRLHRVHGRQAGRRHPRSHPRARSESAMVVGHDWGGTVAWTLAMNHPELVDRLAILNAAHPRKLTEGLRNPRQLLRSWYFFYFQTPRLPERRARRRHWRFFKRFLRDARPPYTPQELDRYVEAWSQPEAAKAMIDYYRAAVR